MVLRVGKGRTPWADEACAEWLKRMRRNVPVEEKLLKPRRFTGDVEAVRTAEAAAILGELRAGDRLIALDERGDTVTTEGLAGWVQALAAQGTRRVVFAIGGPHGHGRQVRDAAWRVLALTPMVLNHELARVVIVEQLYRVHTLLWGGAYHH